MKIKKLPFAIGEQYELHEFELDGIETILAGDYEFDVYRYRKELVNNLGIDGLNNVVLYYNADILARAIYFFRGSIDLSAIDFGSNNVEFEYIGSLKMSILDIKGNYYGFN